MSPFHFFCSLEVWPDGLEKSAAAGVQFRILRSGRAPQDFPEGGLQALCGHWIRAGAMHLLWGSARPWLGLITRTCPSRNTGSSPQIAASPHCQGQLNHRELRPNVLESSWDSLLSHVL